MMQTEKVIQQIFDELRKDLIEEVRANEAFQNNNSLTPAQMREFQKKQNDRYMKMAMAGIALFQGFLKDINAIAEAHRKFAAQISAAQISATKMSPGTPDGEPVDDL